MKSSPTPIFENHLNRYAHAHAVFLKKNGSTFHGSAQSPLFKGVLGILRARGRFTMLSQSFHRGWYDNGSSWYSYGNSCLAKKRWAFYRKWWALFRKRWAFFFCVQLSRYWLQLIRQRDSCSHKKAVRLSKKWYDFFTATAVSYSGTANTATATAIPRAGTAISRTYLMCERVVKRSWNVGNAPAHPRALYLLGLQQICERWNLFCQSKDAGFWLKNQISHNKQ